MAYIQKVLNMYSIQNIYEIKTFTAEVTLTPVLINVLYM
jgi:hypothetical protein